MIWTPGRFPTDQSARLSRGAPPRSQLPPTPTDQSTGSPCRRSRSGGHGLARNDREERPKLAWRTEHDVPITEQRAPLLLDSGARTIGGHPVAVADDRAAGALRHQAIVVWLECLRPAVCLKIEIGWPECGE